MSMVVAPLRYVREALIARDYRFKSVFPDLSALFPEFRVPDASVEDTRFTWTLYRPDRPATLLVWVCRGDHKTAGFTLTLQRHGQDVIVWERENPGIVLDEMREIKDLMLVSFNIAWVIRKVNELQERCGCGGTLTYNTRRINTDIVYENIKCKCFRGRYSENGIEGLLFEDAVGMHHILVPTDRLAHFDVRSGTVVRPDLHWDQIEALIEAWDG